MTDNELKDLAIAYREVFGGERGKKILGDLKHLTGYGFSFTSVRENPIDPLAIVRDAAQYNVVQYIVYMMERDLSLIGEQVKAQSEQDSHAGLDEAQV
jgi:hypothetical protein